MHGHMNVKRVTLFPVTLCRLTNEKILLISFFMRLLSDANNSDDDDYDNNSNSNNNNNNNNLHAVNFSFLTMLIILTSENKRFRYLLTVFLIKPYENNESILCIIDVSLCKTLPLLRLTSGLTKNNLHFVHIPCSCVPYYTTSNN